MTARSSSFWIAPQGAGARLLGLALAGALLAGAALASEGLPSNAPHWLWLSDESPAGQTVFLHHSFELDELPAEAFATAAGDNAFELYVNGAAAFDGNHWEQPVRDDVSQHLRIGHNVLAVVASNEGGPAGFWLALELSSADGEPSGLSTDETWFAADGGEVEALDSEGAWRELLPAPQGPGAPWRRAHSLGRLGVAPWGMPGAAVPPDRALASGALDVPEGFTVERVYEVPPEQGSWVSLTFDPRGRVLTCAQYGALYRFDPTHPARGAAALELGPPDAALATLGAAQGLSFQDGALYVVINGTGEHASRLVRLAYADGANGDDTFGRLDEILPFAGHGEHGPHAIVPAGDGSFYIVAGNHTALPAPLASPQGASRVPRVWGEDHVLAELSDPNGHAVGCLAPGGWIARWTPATDSWELVAIGLRNAYDLAFDADGELFTYDSDMEWDIGLPWYRAPRILHVTSGAEYGWRQGSGKWPSHYADSLPAVVETPAASPTGLVHGARTSFPPPYDRALFAADWAYGVLYAIHLEPRGASFSGRVERFVAGRPLPIADLAIGPAGDLWFVTGGRGLRSALYRIAPRKSSGESAARATGGARVGANRRRELEALHHSGASPTLAQLWADLASSDRHLRFAARVALEHALLLEPARALFCLDQLADPEARLGEPPTGLATLETLVAVARTGEPGPVGAPFWRTIASLSAAEERALDARGALLLVRVLQLGLTRFGEVGGLGSSVCESLLARLGASFPTGDARLDRELVRLAARAAPQLSVLWGSQRLAHVDDQAELAHYALCLRAVRGVWDASTREVYADALRRLETGSGGASFTKYAAAIRSAAGEPGGPLDGLAFEPPTELTPTPWPVPGPTPGPKPGPASFVRHWTLPEIEPELDQLLEPGARSAEAGALAMTRANCLSCHRFDGQGASSGPDLTGAGGRFSARDLARAVLEPHAAVSDQYRDTIVWTRAGGPFVGRLVREDSTVVLAAADGSLITLAATEVLERRLSALSRMPDGLVDVLEREELLDLFAWLLAGGDPEHPAFAPSTDPRR